MIGCFTVLYAAMPSDLFLNQPEYQVVTQEREVMERFEATDLAVYSSAGQDTMLFEYSSIVDAPDPPQWETQLERRFLEVWWGAEEIPDVGYIGDMFEVRDTEEREFIITYYVRLEWCYLRIIEEDDTITDVGNFFSRDVLAPYGALNNISLTATGEYLSASIILRAETGHTLIQDWDAGTLAYDITYELDFAAMKPNAFMLIASLLSFQAPEFGIPGLFGEIISYVFGLAIWAVIAIVAYTIITKLIPTIQGGIEN